MDGVNVLRPTQHRIGHFADVLPSQSIGFILKKLKPTQQKQATQESDDLTQKHTNAKPKQAQKNDIKI